LKDGLCYVPTAIGESDVLFIGVSNVWYCQWENEHVQKHYNDNYSKLNNTDRAVLSLISRYASMQV